VVPPGRVHGELGRQHLALVIQDALDVAPVADIPRRVEAERRIEAVLMFGDRIVARVVRDPPVVQQQRETLRRREPVEV
jgi:hypothetical protein